MNLFAFILSAEDAFAVKLRYGAAQVDWLLFLPALAALIYLIVFATRNSKSVPFIALGVGVIWLIYRLITRNFLELGFLPLILFELFLLPILYALILLHAKEALLPNERRIMKWPLTILIFTALATPVAALIGWVYYSV